MADGRSARVLLSFALCVTGCTRTALAPEPPPASVAPPATALSTTVRLSLVSDASRLLDAPFWLAARFEPPDGAHLYWLNPGETGLATTAEFVAPDGFELSPVGYPGPVSFRSERGTVGYGYLGETVLLVRVTPQRPAGQATFWVRARWLSCDALCVEERGEASLTLRRDELTESISLDAFVARLPIANANLAAEWTSARAFSLRGPADARLLEWFPFAPIGVDERAPESTPLEGGGLEVTLAQPPASAPQRGVVRAEAPDGPRYYEVNVSPAPELTGASEGQAEPAPK